MSSKKVSDLTCLPLFQALELKATKFCFKPRNLRTEIS